MKKVKFSFEPFIKANNTSIIVIYKLKIIMEILLHNQSVRTTRIIPANGEGVFSPKHQYSIPFIPYETKEGGYDFRGDYCVDKEGIRCPLYGICSLIIKRSNVVGAKLDCRATKQLPDEVQAQLMDTYKDPLTEKVLIQDYTLSNLRKLALCAGIEEIDPNRIEPMLDSKIKDPVHWWIDY